MAVEIQPIFLASLNSHKNVLYISAEYNSMLRFDMKNRRFMNEFAIEDKKRTYPLIIDGGQLFVNTTWGIEVLSCTTNRLQYTIVADDDMKTGSGLTSSILCIRKELLCGWVFFRGNRLFTD